MYEGKTAGRLIAEKMATMASRRELRIDDTGPRGYSRRALVRLAVVVVVVVVSVVDGFCRERIILSVIK